LKGNTPTIDEPVSEERWKPLPERSDDPIPDPVEVREEDANSISLALINDFQETYSEEQRQNLYQKISEMSSSEKLLLKGCVKTPDQFTPAKLVPAKAGSGRP